LYGCKTYSVTLREKYGLKVFENKLLRKAVGRTKKEVTWDRRKVQSAELHCLYSLLNIIKSRRINLTELVPSASEKGRSYMIIVWDVKARGHSEDRGIDGNKILKRI
jgi:hypothetical protein